MCFCSKTTICKRANSSTLVFVKVPPTTTFINLLLLEQQLSTHCVRIHGGREPGSWQQAPRTRPWEPGTDFPGSPRREPSRCCRKNHSQDTNIVIHISIHLYRVSKTAKAGNPAYAVCTATYSTPDNKIKAILDLQYVFITTKTSLTWIVADCI